MLAIRMQRTGRKGHAMFRVVVQDTRNTPTSGKVVAQLGHYDPHTKAVSVDKEKASFYLSNGAQPSDRAARLLKSEGVELPSWVKAATEKTKAIRNPEKLRKNQPKEEAPVEEKVEEAPEAPAEAEAVAEETPTEATAE
jgi:small subunit ribosomal protein S16